MAPTFPDDGIRHFLQTAIALPLFVIFFGSALLGLLCPWMTELRETWRRRLAVSGIVIALGTAILAITSVALAEIGRLELRWLVLALLILHFAGTYIGWKKITAHKLLARDLGFAALLAIAASTAVMLLPHRGEWLLGGWDPGIYVNQGIHVARIGSFHDGPLPWAKFFTSDDWQLFTRGTQLYREIAPGVPVDTATGTIQPYFFRLLPGLIASLDLLGGLRAATRISDFMALFGLITFAGMLAAWGRSAIFIITATALLILQPLWLYHAHLPTTEMLHLLLLCGIGLLLPHRHGKTSILIALLIFALILNRFDFAAFSALLIAIIAVLDFPRDDRRTVMRERAVQFAGLAAGFLTDLLLCHVTILRLDFAVPKLILAMFAFVAAAFATDILANNPRLRATLLRPQHFWRIAPTLAILCALPAVLILRNTTLASHLAPAAANLIPFIGPLILATAAAGLLLWLLPRDTTREEKLFTLYLLLITAALLIEAGIVPTYPWSTRRFLPCLIPALAILAAAPITALAAAARNTAPHPQPPKFINLATLTAAVALALIAWTTRGPIQRAIRSTEYDGASQILAQIAAQIPPDALLIADHHWWSTPLTLIHNRPTLDGNFLIRTTDTNTLPRALQAAHRWQNTGQQIYLLTSTPDALAIYKHPIPPTRLAWTSAPVTLREVIHTKTARTIETKTRTYTFQLHHLLPAHPATGN